MPPDRCSQRGIRPVAGDGGFGADCRHGERRNQRGRFLEQRGIGIDDTRRVRIIGLAGRWFGWLIFQRPGQRAIAPRAGSTQRMPDEQRSEQNRTEQNRTEQKTYGEVVNVLAQRGQPAAETSKPLGASAVNTEVVALSGVSRSLEEWWTSPRRPVGTCCDLRRCPGERAPAATPVRALRLVKSGEPLGVVVLRNMLALRRCGTGVRTRSPEPPVWPWPACLARIQRPIFSGAPFLEP